MNDLVHFAKRIKAQLAKANREPHWEPGEAERYMAEFGTRRERFEQLTLELTDGVIRPRLETLAGYFPNTNFPTREPARHCSCWFGYCERFPVTAKIAFSIEHDVRFEKVAVCYEASMIPVFIKLCERDKLESTLDSMNGDDIAAWIEERLLEFLDAYLRIDRGREDFDEDTATDPVCGMRISRSTAEASGSYRGHPYFFCSLDCQERFSREPTAYVEVKAM